MRLLGLLPVILFAWQAGAQRTYFQFDTRSGDYQLGPDGSVQYTGASVMPASLGTVTVSSGTTTVNGQTIPRGMQIWTVGVTGWYDIVAGGARASTNTAANANYLGGRGVTVKTRFYLTAGDKMVVLVGAQPPCAGGAGGGSFVSRYSATAGFSTSSQHLLLLAAGGGGGYSGYTDYVGVDATVSTTGQKCKSNPATAAATLGGGGGASSLAGGSGATKGSSSNAQGYGAGGGGFLGDGGDAYTTGSALYQTTGGKSFLNGGAGGVSIYKTRSSTACDAPEAGFGGGGGYWNTGAGGGGYSGGQGCTFGGPGGGGGGSYDVKGASNAGTLYTSWDTAMFGPAPTGYASGYMSSNGIVAVSWPDTHPVFALVGENNAGNLRKIDLATKEVTTITFGSGITNVGQVAVSADASFALVPDCWNNRVQKVILSSSVTSIIAGTATASRLDGTGTNAGFRCPRAIAIHPSNAYALIADRDNNAIRKLDLTSLAVTTYAGICSGTAQCTAGNTNGLTLLASSFGSPQGIAIHPDGLSAYVADNTYCLIRKITLSPTELIQTVAGTGTCAITGLTGVGTSVGLGSMPTCRISPGGGTLLFPDRSAMKMKLLDLNTFAVSNAFFTGPFDLLDGDWMGTQTSMLVLDYAGNKVMQQTYPGGVSTVFAGSGVGSSGNGIGASATFNTPITVTVWRCGIPGYGIVTSDAVCERCPVGKYSTRGELCLACPAGTYASAIGASACTLCPTNTHPNRWFTACLANAGYYIASSGVQFPPSPFMSDASFTTSGGEIFTASSSSNYPGQMAYLAFSVLDTSAGFTTELQWNSGTASYATTGVLGAYTGTYSSIVDGGTILGEWLQLQTSLRYQLGAFSIPGDATLFARMPVSFVLAGSNDGSTWTSLQTVSGLSAWTSKLLRTFSVPHIQSWAYFRLIVTNVSSTSDGYSIIDKLRFYDAQLSTCTGTCSAGTTKFCSPDGATSYCCTPSQYFIPGVSTACTNCPANSMADLVYQERCVANAGFLAPSLYMFDGSTPTYQNLGSKTSHVVTPVGWRPTFASPGTRTGAYFDSSVNGNYYTVSNDYNTITLAFWMYLSGPYHNEPIFQFEPLCMQGTGAGTRGFNFDIVTYPAESNTGAAFLFVCYASGCASATVVAQTFPVTTWLHVVLVIPNSPSVRQQRVYVNGVLKATRTDTATQDFLSNYQRLLLAVNLLYYRYYKGYLQQLTMYNYAMTDAEVTTLYNSGTPLVYVPCPGTCATGLVKHCLPTGVAVCCPPGTFFRAELDSACQGCPAGTYSLTSGSSCTLCPAGTFRQSTSQIAGIPTFTTNGVHSSCSLNSAYLDSTQGWCAATAGTNLYYLVADAGAARLIDSVTTQGRSDYAQWVTSYDLSYSLDSATWTVFATNLAGNTDQNTKITYSMNVVARYLKFLPQGYNSHPSMRVGFSAGTSTISTILPSSCLTCPANSASNAGRTGCVANAGYYNLDASLLAYFPFRPENIYADASGGGYTLTDTNGALYKPQSEFMTGPFAGAGVALLDNNNILDSTRTGRSFQVSVGAGLDVRSLVGTGAAAGVGFTICFWYRARDGSSTPGVVNTLMPQTLMALARFNTVQASSPFEYNDRVSYYRDSTFSSSMFWEVYPSTGHPTYFSSGNYARYTRNWIHQCVAFAGRARLSYYDCDSPTCSASGGIFFNDWPQLVLPYVYLGQSGTDKSFYGWMADVRLYKKALTPAEVFAVRSYSGATAFSVNGDPALLAYYPFSSSASLYQDASGNGYTLQDANTGGGYSPSYGGGTGTTSPSPGLGSAYFANSAGTAVTTATGSLIRGFRVSVGTGWSLSSTIGTAASPGPGFTWCYWLRGVDSAAVQYPFVFTIGNVFTSVNVAGFYGFYDGKNSGNAQGGSGTNYFYNGNPLGAGGVGMDGVYTTGWVHMCFTWQGKTFKAYRNCGSSACTPTASTTLSQEAYTGLYTQVLIGQGTYGTGWYGWLSEFRFYKKALTPAEVFAIKSYDGTSQTAVNSVNSGLLAYYPFHPNAFLVDASGVTGSLVPTGSPASIPGSMTDLQNVAYFAQTSGVAKASSAPQYFTIPSITFGSYFSVCAWYNPDNAYSGGYAGVIMLTSGVNTGDIQIRRDLTWNNLVVQLQNSATVIAAVTFAGLYQVNVWQHVCLTVTGTTGKLYYNGALQATTITLSAQKLVTTFTSSYLGGMNPYSNDLYRGQLDEVRIYGRAITQAEVTSIYNFRGDTATPGIILPCVPCSAGSSGSCSPDGTAQCTACAAGSYSGTSGASACTACLPGTFYATTGASACTACATGTYSVTSGASLSSTCTACAAGTYSVTSGASLSSTCTACAAGTYSVTSGASLSSTCTACSIGLYTGKTGVSACTACPANTWSASAASNCTANLGYYNLDDNLKAYYPFNPDAFLADVTGITGSLTASAFSPTSQASGPWVSSYSASLTASSTQYFSLPSFKLPNTMSICSWFFLSSPIPGNYNRVWDFSTGTGLDDGTDNILLTRPDNINMYFQVRRGATIVGGSMWTGAALTNTWRHACLTVSGTDGKAWIDNVGLAFPVSGGRNFDILLTSNFIGKSNWFTDALWYGAFDDFRIYTKALTSTEISALYAFQGDTYSPMIILACPTPCSAGTYGGCNAQSVATCTGCLAGTFSTGTGMLTSAACGLCGAGTYAGNSASVCTSCSAGSFSSKTGASVCAACPSNSWSTSAASKCTANLGFYNLDDNLKAYYPFNPDGFLTDVTGITGSLTASVSSPTSQAYGPFGASSYSAFLTAGAINGAENYQYFMLPSLTLPNDLTICSWFWISSNINRAWNRLWDFGESYGNFNLAAGIIDNSQTLYVTVVRDGIHVGVHELVNAAQPATWKHVCMALSGTSQLVWLDGTSTAYTMSVARDTAVQLRTNYLGGNYWYGAIDDFRIYTKALTNTEMSALYAFRGDTYSPMIILACPNPCAAGTYGGCNAQSVATCTACSAGTFSTGTGMLTSAACGQCGAGTYAGTSAPACTPCSAGTYSTGTGFQISASCIACGAGTYSTALGAIAAITCQTCLIGTYMGSTGASVCSSCPSDSWSTSAASKCTANLGYYNLDDNLKAYYPFNPNGFLTDVTGITGSLTPSGSSPISQTSGPFGDTSYSAWLNGDGQFFSIPSLTLPDSMSICSWFYVSASSGKLFQRIWEFGIGSANEIVYAMLYFDSLSFGVFKGTDGYGYELAGGAQGNSYWRHTCLTVSGTNAVASLNGASYSFTVTGGRNYNTVLTGNFIGKSNWGWDYWGGAVDDFRVYTKALTASEIAALYAFRGDTYSPMIMLACPNPCAPGTYGGCTSSGTQACTVCSAGTFNTGTGMLTIAACGQCSAGKYAGTSASACTPCSAGTYLTGTGFQTSAGCTAYGAGGYSTALGAVSVMTIENCFAGTYSTGVGLQASASCTRCGAGTYSTALGAVSALTCQNCFAGTYFTGTGLQVSAACTACSAGTYSGTVGASLAGTCSACSAGKYSGTVGASLAGTCSACSAGKYSGTVGASLSSVCTACSAGTYSGTTGASLVGTCSACSAGTYSLSAGASSLEACVVCGAGTYSLTTGASLASACTACSTGTYSGATGASLAFTCSSCTAGSFSSKTGASVCSLCPSYSWSASAASKCTANLGFYNLDDNLKAYYPFNPDGFLTDVTGITGSLTASASSPTSQAPGPFGDSSYSAFLTGSASTVAADNQYFTLPAFTLPNDVTICSWIWISSSITRGWNRVWDFAVGAGNSNILVGIYSTTNSLGFEVYGVGPSLGFQTIANGAQTVNTWRHVCMTLSGTSQAACLDSTCTALTMSNSRDVAVQLTSNYIGRSNWVDWYWYGAFDDFRIYTKALTTPEMSALYAFRGDTYSPMIILACPNPCAAGTYGGCNAQSVATCTACSAGKFSTGTGMLTIAACGQCTAGTYAGTSASACTPCSAGTYLTGVGFQTSAGCTACGAGTYSGTSGASLVGTCLACGAGTYALSGRAACTPCNSGLGVCAAGTFARCATTGLLFSCCGAKQYYRENIDSACQTCITAGTGGDGSGSACSLCTYGLVSSVTGSPTVYTDKPGTNVYQFKLPGSIAFSRDMRADILLVGGGGAGGSAIGGGGGAGTLIFASDTLFPGGASHAVTVGAGGTKGSNNVRGGSGSASSIGSLFSAAGGGGGGAWDAARPSNGGSGGAGGAYPNSGSPGGTVASTSIVFGVSSVSVSANAFAYAGGSGSTSNPGLGMYNYRLHGGGGGGAGALGGNDVTGSTACASNDLPSCGSCGSGGNGMRGVSVSGKDFDFPTVFGNGYTSVASSSFIAGGGGGGACCSPSGYAFTTNTCPGGAGGGGAGYRGSARASSDDGLINTGSGGGGGADNSPGGNGGVGLVLISVAYANCVCGTGTFTSSAGCAGCPAGTYATGDGLMTSSDCASCAAGSFSTGVGLSSCTACSAGTYFTGTRALTCTACLAGTYLVVTGASNSGACTACGAGTYSGVSGASLSSVCTACGAGTYATALGASSSLICQTCFAGTYFTGTGLQAGASCTRCGAGTYSTALGAVLSATCQTCFAGTYFTGTGLQASASCTRCGAGTYSTALGAVLSATCQTCFAGTYFTGTGLQAGASCTACGAGTYSTALGAVLSATCQTCFAGTYFTGTGLQAGASCTACGAGMYSTALGAVLSATCQTCFAGTYFTGTGLQAGASCTACGAGMYSTALGAISSQACQNCVAGTYQTGAGMQASANCLGCGAGRFSTALAAATSLTCQSCSAGTYETGTGMPAGASCDLCGAGTFSTVSGAVSVGTCTACIAGTYSSTVGATQVGACTVCPTGTYSGTAGQDSLQDCTPCPTGTYSAATGAIVSSTCSACRVGTYGPTAGTSTCTACPMGKFSNTAGNSFLDDCLSCQAGSYMKDPGASGCTSCSAGTFSTALGANSLTICASCSPGSYSDMARSSACTACPASSNVLSSGASQRGACTCNAGFAADLSITASLCQPCPANSYCQGLSQLTCPLHTHSQALSSLQAHCRCDAGYRCTYRRDAKLTITFDAMTELGFASQASTIRGKLAVAADVPVASVTVLSYKSVYYTPVVPPPPPSASM